MMRTAALLALLCATAMAAPDLSLPEFTSETAERDMFGPQAYKFTFPNFLANTPAGTIQNMDITSNPFLGTLPHGGLAQFVDTFEACTVNVPHVHPRGNEIYFVIEGVLQAGIQEETTGSFSLLNFTAGQLVVVPQGLMHFVFNPSCNPTKLVQFWDNADFGTVILYANLINNFPEEVLEGVTGLDASMISALKAAVPQPTGAIVQAKSCLATCGGSSSPPPSSPSSSPPSSPPPSNPSPSSPPPSNPSPSSPPPSSPPPSPSPSSPSPNPSPNTVTYSSNSPGSSSSYQSSTSSNGSPAVANAEANSGRRH